MKHIISLFKEDVQHLLHHSWKQIIGLGFLVGGLLFLLNIFLGVSLFTHWVGDVLKDKLGMYFYINDAAGDQSSVYGRVNELQKTLESQGLTVNFSSKDDAIKFLEKKMPDVVTNLQKFGVDNPLPSTLYVMFDSTHEYDILRDTIIGYKDLILNNKDLEASNLQGQDSRTLNILTMANAISRLSIVIVLLILIVIFAFLGYLFTTVFDHFKKHFEIKKMLGASLWEMIQDFVAVNSMVIGIWFVVAIGLLLLSSIWVSLSFVNLFGIGMQDLFSYFTGWTILLLFFGEIIILFGGSLVFATIRGWKLQKKI